MTIVSLIDSAFALRLTSTILHFLWQGTVIALLASLASQLLVRASAQARYLVHCGALMLMAICVTATFVLVSVDLPAGVSVEAQVLETPVAASDEPTF